MNGSMTNGAMADDLVKDTDTPHFPADVMEASKKVPVLVDFWAPWCGPCRQLGPAIERAVRARNGAVKLVKINVDENQALAGQMGVQSIPAVFAFAGGQPVDGFMGALPESEINRFIDQLLEKAGAPANDDNGLDAQVKQALDVAKRALEAGETEQAAGIYQMIMQQVPGNLDAALGLAGCLVELKDFENAKAVLETIDSDKRKGPVYDAIVKGIALAEEAAKLGNGDDLVERIAANPDDFQSYLDLAVIKNVSGDRIGAAETLIAAFKRDRDWNEAAARRKLLEFFEAWGPKDDATLKGRRLLSSAMFS